MTTFVLWTLVKMLALLVFINRYLAGVLLRILRGKNWDKTRDDYEPTVTVVIPMFNEGEAVRETLASLLESDYPRDKFEIVCVDDCSSDNSYAIAQEIARKSDGLLRVIRNKHDNWLTRMQVIKYWYGYFFLKNLEWGFRRVMCLSGCLTAYRRHVLVELEPVLEQRSILGVSIKYGEDRFLTRQIIKAGYLTTMTHAARCRTFVPTKLPEYFSQQLRWRRSNIVDYSGAVSHVWKLNPFLAIHFFAQFALLVAYPITVIRALSAGWFYEALQLHLYLLACFGVYYWFRVRKRPAAERVGPLALLPLALLMPITYALLTPLALFTLDSGSWETRGHGADEEADADATTTTTTEIPASTGVLVPALATKRVQSLKGDRHTGPQAQLPAA